MDWIIRPIDFSLLINHFMFISWHQKIRKGLYHFALAIFAPSPCLFLLGSKHSKQFQTSIHPRFGTGKAVKPWMKFSYGHLGVLKMSEGVIHQRRSSLKQKAVVVGFFVMETT